MSSTQQAAATFNGATPASRETPINEPETHSGDLIFSEGSAGPRGWCDSSRHTSSNSKRRR